MADQALKYPNVQTPNITLSFLYHIGGMLPANDNFFDCADMYSHVFLL